ncbi:MAG: 50S ribosomal protein L10 [Dehalococcoidia bacterium]|nr:50S ribosomal protein L10 [Dehalococcoidia bacterium]MDW8120560.1 50S ribosomal protein L10 [Chloroflexota bacterium]
MPSEKNRQAVAALKERLGRSTLIISTSFTGLPVSAMTDLRRRLREKGLEYKVVRNTLATIAAREAGREGLKDILQGPTGLVLTQKDPVEAVKGFEEVLKAIRLPLTVRGALLDGQVLTPAQLTALTTLPPKPVLIATLVGRVRGPMAALAGHVKSPMVALVGVLQGPIQSLATVLKRAAQKQGEPSTASPA